MVAKFKSKSTSQKLSTPEDQPLRSNFPLNSIVRTIRAQTGSIENRAKPIEQGEPNDEAGGDDISMKSAAETQKIKGKKKSKPNNFLRPAPRQRDESGIGNGLEVTGWSKAHFSVGDWPARSSINRPIEAKPDRNWR